MASRVAARSAKDATRFTSTIPHATSKAAGPSIAAKASAPAARPSPRVPGETPEQRVRRLRLAHLAAQKAQISRTDRFLDVSRRVLDAVHRWTVAGIVVFTVVATIVSIYSVWDMLRYNRARRTEWVEAQKKFENDDLAAARLAYIRGDATDEQVLLVETANREAEASGIKLPPLLAPPEHRTHFEEHVKPVVAPTEGKGKGVFGFFGGGKAETQTQETGVVRSAEASAGRVQEKAQDVWAQEKDNQRKGGSLDQLGLAEDSAKPVPGKKGWWPW